jgi:hypothetical protein
MKDDLIKFETAEGEHIGWARLATPATEPWPDILTWGGRFFRFASPDGDVDYRLYIETAPCALLVPVRLEKEPPP